MAPQVWWAHRTPLKYDQVAGSHAVAWEQEHHPATAPQKWFGHCHAWSAASVTECEPSTTRRYRAIDFGVGDLKGLLAASHGNDVANTYGDRFGDRQGSEDRADLAPDQLWMLVQLYVRQQRLPLILDLEPGEEVWNYPVYQYQVDYKGTRPAGPRASFASSRPTTMSNPISSVHSRSSMPTRSG